MCVNSSTPDESQSLSKNTLRKTNKLLREAETEEAGLRKLLFDQKYSLELHSATSHPHDGGCGLIICYWESFLSLVWPLKSLGDGGRCWKVLWKKGACQKAVWNTAKQQILYHVRINLCKCELLHFPV